MVADLRLCWYRGIHHCTSSGRKGGGLVAWLNTRRGLGRRNLAPEIRNPIQSLPLLPSIYVYKILNQFPF